MEDNKNKLHLISKLKEVNNFINALVLDCNQKLNIIQSINDISSSIEKSYEATMLHIKRVNPAASQTEEACERIQKRKKDCNNNVAHILFSMHDQCAKKPQFLHIELPRMETSG